MKIKRMKRKCDVPGCKNTDTIVIGKKTYFDNGCLHLCAECTAMYGKAWSEAKKADAEKAKAEKAAVDKQKADVEEKA